MKKFTIAVTALMVSTVASVSYAAGNLPFVGTRVFNFSGGNATEESITIKKDGTTVIKAHGTSGSFVLYKGKYQQYLPIHDGGKLYNYYRVQGNTIQRLNTKKQLENDCYKIGADGEVPCVVTLYK